MTLIVHEFKNTLQGGTIFQWVKTTEGKDFWGIRAHLLRFGNPSGTIQFKIYDVNDRLVQAGPAIPLSSIGTGTYWHGYYPLENKLDLPAGIYKFLLATSGGYSFGGGNYVGWCNDYDLRKYELDYLSDSDLKDPLDFEAWSYKWRDLMRVLDYDDGFTSNHWG